MNKCIFLCLCVLSLFPLVGVAQDTTAVELEEYVEQLNDQCPIDYKDGWCINSFTMVEDRYALVDMGLPSSLSMFFSTLTADKDNVKRLWVRQLEQYGERWNHFVDLLVAADRRLVINMCPEDCEKSALLSFQPSDFKKE